MSMPHDRPERRYAYLVTPPHDQVVISPPNRGNSRLEALKALAHQPPRTFGHPTSLWTLDLLASESVRQGLCPCQVSGQTIRRSLLRIDVSWKRAKRWITSPDPEYARKKGGATA